MTQSMSKLPQCVDFLNQEFGNSKIKFIQVAPQLIKAVLNFSAQACAEVHLQGAHLTRWSDLKGRDNIFTSANAVYKVGVPIRGGNPLIFPQFGAGEMCQHGFARNSLWQVTASEITAKATTITLVLKPTDVQAHYRKQWSHDFVVTLTLSLGETLVTQMKVYNPNSYALSFTQGFHTYLAVDNINETEINGFSGLEYMDNLRNRTFFLEEREQIIIDDIIDRRYQNIPDIVTLKDNSSGRVIVMKTKNCQDAFVWNPWEESSKKLFDLKPLDYQKFVCIEPGNMKTVVILESGQEFKIEQLLKVF